MNLQFITEHLKKNYQANSLGHLYTIRYSPKSILPITIKNEILLSLLNTHFENHPDVLFLDRDEGEKIYKTDSKNMNYFLKFLDFKPVNLSHKFIFINDAHLISEIYLNKLLKTFEELNYYSTIFLLIPNQHEILPTIKSRSINIQIQKKDDLKIAPMCSDYSLTGLVNEIKKDPANEENIVNTIIEKSIVESSDFIQLSHLLNTLKSYDEQKNFNNSTLSRVAQILP
jgi:hypothetical protein